MAINTVNALIEDARFALRIGRPIAYEGKVLTRSNQDRLFLTHGDSSSAKAGNAPVPWLLLVKPRKAVQRTQPFPPLLAAFRGAGGQLAELSERNACQYKSTGSTSSDQRKFFSFLILSIAGVKLSSNCCNARRFVSCSNN